MLHDGGLLLNFPEPVSGRFLSIKLREVVEDRGWSFQSEQVSSRGNTPTYHWGAQVSDGSGFVMQRPEFAFSALAPFQEYDAVVLSPCFWSDFGVEEDISADPTPAQESMMQEFASFLLQALHQ